MSRRSPTALRREATLLFDAALQAVAPDRLVRTAVQRLPHHARIVLTPTAHTPPSIDIPLPLTVIGAGKASARLAAGCVDVLGPAQVHGYIIVPDGYAQPCGNVTVTTARHPTPDARGLQATQQLVDTIQQAPGDCIVFLLSGGASSLLTWPRPPITVDDLTCVNRVLLACGASIGEMNTVRKHLSLIKGGGLLRHTTKTVVTLAISDVPGDDPSTIGSGVTVPDASTFAEAWAVLERYQVTDQLPDTVTTVLQHGLQGRIAETLAPTEAAARRGHYVLAGSNQTALDGAAAAAHARGWHVVSDEAPLAGDTETSARYCAARLQHLRAQHAPHLPLCVLFGGETTVTLRGDGRGGRNQHFALAMAPALRGHEMVVLSAGTDGIDGPTDAAGAFVDGATLDRATACGLDLDSALQRNDAYPFFQTLDDLLCCGPTGTNVMDIKIALLPAQVSQIAART